MGPPGPQVQVERAGSRPTDSPPQTQETGPTGSRSAHREAIRLWGEPRTGQGVGACAPSSDCAPHLPALRPTAPWPPEGSVWAPPLCSLPLLPASLQLWGLCPWQQRSRPPQPPAAGGGTLAWLTTILGRGPVRQLQPSHLPWCSLGHNNVPRLAQQIPPASM